MNTCCEKCIKECAAFGDSNQEYHCPCHEKPTHEIGWDAERARLVKLIFSEIDAIASADDYRQYVLSEEEIHKLIDEIERQALTHQKESIVAKLDGKIQENDSEYDDVYGYNQGIADAVEVVREV